MRGEGVQRAYDWRNHNIVFHLILLAEPDLGETKSKRSQCSVIPSKCHSTAELRVVTHTVYIITLHTPLFFLLFVCGFLMTWRAHHNMQTICMRSRKGTQEKHFFFFFRNETWMRNIFLGLSKNRKTNTHQKKRSNLFSYKAVAW